MSSGAKNQAEEPPFDQQELIRVLQSVSMTWPVTVTPPERQRLTRAIRDHLYKRCFARNVTQPKTTETAIAADDFRRCLSAANRGRDAWLTGWRVREIKPGGIITVTQGERLRFAKAGDYAMALAEDVPLCIGCGVTIRLRKESLGLQEGTYCALGEESPSPDEEAEVLRIYFNASQEAALSLVEVLTKYFNEWAVPFTLKVMLRPEDRDRSDATVLYLPKNYYRSFVQLLSELPADLLSALREEVPLFTKPLRGGVGLAESPTGGESFGVNRCRLVAEGIVDARLGEHQVVNASIQAIGRRFASEGFSLARPYLNPGSKDIYTTDLAECPPSPHVRRVTGEPIVVTTKTVLAFMQELGLCAENDVQWQVSEYSSRSRNFGIVRSDSSRGFFVKQLRVQDPESCAMMRREAAIYQLAQQNPDFAVLQELTPPFVTYDDDAKVIVLEFLKGESLLKANSQLQRFPVEFGHSLGVALATLHNGVGSAAPPPDIFSMRPPGIFDAHRNGPLMRWLGPGQRLLIAQVREHVQLAHALDELAASWRYDTFIHGDIKFENCMAVDPVSAEPSVSQVMLLDWELADFGEAAWDIGSVLQSYFSASLLAGAGILTESAAQTFWQSYCKASLLVHEATLVLLDRSLQCAAARMLQTALEVMQGQPKPTSQALTLFNASVQLMDDHKRNISFEHFSTSALQNKIES